MYLGGSESIWPPRLCFDQVARSILFSFSRTILASGLDVSHEQYEHSHSMQFEPAAKVTPLLKQIIASVLSLDLQSSIAIP
jgi:hypothetical protein